MSLAWGDLPTWVASVGTVGALGAALAQIRGERNRRLAQEDRDREERLRAQACLISAWPSKEVVIEGDYARGRTEIIMMNSSAEPVYEVAICIVATQGTVPRTLESMLELLNSAENKTRSKPVTTVSILPPGKHMVSIGGTGWTSSLSGRSGVDIAFKDRANRSWIRRASGELDLIEKRPFAYLAGFGVSGPHDLHIPEAL